MRETESVLPEHHTELAILLIARIADILPEPDNGYEFCKD